MDAEGQNYNMHKLSFDFQDTKNIRCNVLKLKLFHSVSQPYVQYRPSMAILIIDFKEALLFWPKII